MYGTDVPRAIDALIRRCGVIRSEREELIRAASQPPPMWPRNDHSGPRRNPTAIDSPPDLRSS
jgi:hypothetical protein